MGYMMNTTSSSTKAIKTNSYIVCYQTGKSDEFSSWGYKQHEAVFNTMSRALVFAHKAATEDDNYKCSAYIRTNDKSRDMVACIVINKDNHKKASKRRSRLIRSKRAAKAAVVEVAIVKSEPVETASLSRLDIALYSVCTIGITYGALAFIGKLTSQG